ncbi:MAG: XRE family transcriptional regulator [Lachnospiraceae bacterium]
MKNPNIAKELKAYRKKNYLSVKDVVDYLSTQLGGRQYSEKTVYGWEKNVSQPPADVLLHLCVLYKIDDILGTFGWTDASEEKGVSLTEEEMAILNAYRENLPMQAAVKKLLDIS